MAMRDPVAEAISRVAALKSVDDRAALSAGLAPLIADNSSYVVARAAQEAGERGVRTLLPQIIETFKRLLNTPPTKDPACSAKLTLAQAIVKLEAGYEAEDVLCAGVHHEHWEPVWGGSTELAAGLRGHCAIGLSMIGSRLALRCAVELLAESDREPPRERKSWIARADAARALTMIGSDGAAAVLRYKVLTGDPEPNVLSDCLAGVIAIEKQEGMDLAERFFTLAGGSRPQPADEANAEAAMVAIGGSRHCDPFSLLKRHAEKFLDSPSRQTFLASIAMTRKEAAIDYLLDLVAKGSSRAISKDAAAALEPLKMLPRVAERLVHAKSGKR